MKRKLTLIAAPAGFGKTTLISEWQATPDGSAWPLAWLSLDESDNDPTRFLSHVIAALQTIMPAIGETALSLLQVQQTQQPPPFEAILTSLLNDIAVAAAANEPSPNATSDFALVLDDYHVIDAPVIHRALTFFLDHLPQAMHIIITSRADPPLSLPRLRVRNQLTEIRAVDLRMTLDETTDFLNQVMDLDLSVEAVTLLERRTEGWIAGLQLTALSLQGANEADTEQFLEAFTGSHRYIVDYLAEEVLQRQPAHIQTFLLQTAILEQLSAPLCDAVLEQADLEREAESSPAEGKAVSSQTILETLEQTNLFVVPLDNKRQWYRYHRLFADFLQSRSQQIHPEKMADLHKRAANWYEAAGFTIQAIEHTLAAGSAEQAIQLIEGIAGTMLVRGETALLQQWLERLPAAMIKLHPSLSLTFAWVLLGQGHLEAAAAWLPSDSDTAQDPILSGGTIALRAIMANASGDTAQTITLSQQALALLPQDNTLLRSMIALNLNAAYWLSGQTEAAEQSLSELHTISQMSKNPTSALIVTSYLANLRLQQGFLRQAHQFFQQALHLIDDWAAAPPEQMTSISAKSASAQPTSLTPSSHNLPLASGVYLGLGELLCEWNDLEGAALHLNNGLEMGRQSGSFGGVPRGHVVLARVLFAQTHLTEALEQLDMAERLVRGSDIIQVTTLLPIIRIFSWLAQDNLAAATHWAEQQALMLDEGSEDQSEYTYWGLARVYIAQGEPEKALDLLAQRVNNVRATDQLSSLIQIWKLKAIAFHAQGDTKLALDALEQALSLAEPEGYIRTFVDEGSTMAALLLMLLEARQKAKATDAPTPTYIHQLLIALDVTAPMPDGAKSAAASQGLVEPLTERELEVLAVIASGLSNKEIAEQLIIAPSTLKTHIKNIYGKLGTHSRIQAVAKATELGLL